MDNKKIDTVVFDIGGVLVELGRFRFLEKKGFTGEKANRVMYATMRSKDWVQMDLNNIPVEEILERFIRNDPGMEAEIRYMFEDLNGIVERRESSLPWLRRIKESGRRILYLSNYSMKVANDNEDAMDFLSHMDGGLLSCDYKVIKPDPAFYMILIEKYGLEPSECVFLDDLEDNLAAARSLGIHTILVKDHEQAAADLKALLEME